MNTGQRSPWPMEGQPPPCFANYVNDNVVSLDTQAVGAGHGGTIPQLARVSIVNYRGELLHDLWVLPQSPVTGVPKNNTKPPEGVQFVPFSYIQSVIGSLLEGKVIVGHSLWDSFSILGFSHEAALTRDVELYWPFRIGLKTTDLVRLQTLMYRYMGRHVQRGTIDSLENARAALDLYRSVQEFWEDYLRRGIWPCQIPPERMARCFR